MNKLAGFLLLLVAGVVGWLVVAEMVTPASIELQDAKQVVEVAPDSKTVRVDFTFTANVPISITHVESSCDCAVFSQLPVHVASGERALIHADIDLSKFRIWPAERTFVFYTNPPVEQRPLGKIQLIQSRIGNNKAGSHVDNREKELEP